MLTIDIHVWFLSNKASELLLIKMKLMVALYDVIFVYILPADRKIAQFVLNHSQGQNDSHVLFQELDNTNITRMVVLDLVTK